MSRVNHVFWSAALICGLALLTTGCGGGDSGGGSSTGGGTPKPSAPSTGGSATGGGTSTSTAELGPAAEGGWGTLVVTFQYGGDAPERPAINVTNDPQYCGQFGLREEHLIVNPDNKGIANVFLWMTLKATDPDPPIHEMYEESATTPVKLDNHECEFLPHCLLLRTTQPLVIGNSDTVGHNTKGEPPGNPSFNQTVTPGNELTIDPLPKPLRNPFRVNCNIHPWMNGQILVQSHPYMGLSDDSGEIRIENVPAGTWKFTAWHEVPGYITTVSKDGAEEEWARGQVTVTINDGEETSLGTLVVPASGFSN